MDEKSAEFISNCYGLRPWIWHHEVFLDVHSSYHDTTTRRKGKERQRQETEERKRKRKWWTKEKVKGSRGNNDKQKERDWKHVGKGIRKQKGNNAHRKEGTEKEKRGK